MAVMATTKTSSAEYLTLADIAERLGVTKMTARRYLDAGKFPHAIREAGRSDGRWLVPMFDVEQSGIGRRYRHRPLPTSATEPAGGQESTADVGAMAETILAQARTIERLVAVIAALTAGDSDGT